MKLRPFIPAVTEIPASEADEIPGLAEAISYWSGGREAGEWFREVEDHWGSPGLVMRRGSETLGYAFYAPVEHLPRALYLPAGPISQDAVLLAYASGDGRTRKHLLVRILKELRLRGVSGVEAIGSDFGLARHHLATGHLLECGWRPVRRGWSRGFPYTLTRVELGNTVEVGEIARSLIGRVRLPSFERPAPAPGAYRRRLTNPGLGVEFSEPEDRTPSGTNA